MFEKNLELGFLLDFYGGLLKDRVREVMNLYFNEDLSLTEIGENLGISRQGVQSIVKKGEQELFKYEEKLGLAERFLKLRDMADGLEKVAATRELDRELKEKISELIKEVKK
ncbi:MAG: DNA-binding protein [Clostridia bacterium]|nr:DNA-binding protein [Clostridia bacterium]